jgi:hypothetical protein
MRKMAGYRYAKELRREIPGHMLSPRQVRGSFQLEVAAERLTLGDPVVSHCPEDYDLHGGDFPEEVQAIQRGNRIRC